MPYLNEEGENNIKNKEQLVGQIKIRIRALCMSRQLIENSRIVSVLERRDEAAQYHKHLPPVVNYIRGRNDHVLVHELDQWTLLCLVFVQKVKDHLFFFHLKLV